ncbi:hypothetical protein LguiA_010690 [Lonicera macranthoides]
MENEEEALFRSYPYALYFVQSPSTLSHANTSTTFHSPLRSSENFPAKTHPSAQQLALSHYSSSRGSSNNSFLRDKNKIGPYDLQSHGTGVDSGRHQIEGVTGGGEEEEEEEEEEGEDEGEEWYFGKKKRRGCWWRYFSYRNSSSCVWICLQIGLRLMVSLGAALLVFYIATKPPPPILSVKMGGIGEFGLGEGVDGSGVTTKILSCNCTVEMVIDNKSKLFGLHIHPPFLSLSFTNIPFAFSHGPQELYAPIDGSASFKLYVGTKNKPMYGAGRSMQDMLESGKGLPLMIHMSFGSTFHVISNFIEPKFHHKAQCLLLLGKAYDKKHRTQSYHSSCIVTS